MRKRRFGSERLHSQFVTCDSSYDLNLTVSVSMSQMIRTLSLVAYAITLGSTGHQLMAVIFLSAKVNNFVS